MRLGRGPSVRRAERGRTAAWRIALGSPPGGPGGRGRGPRRAAAAHLEGHLTMERANRNPTISPWYVLASMNNTAHIMEAQEGSSCAHACALSREAGGVRSESGSGTT